MTKADGFSLVEVLISASILAVVLLAIASMFPTGYRDVDWSGERTAAVALAQQRMETLRNQPYAALAAGTTIENLAGDYVGYTRTTTIQDDTPMAGIKELTVTVAAPPSGRNVLVMSLIAQ